MSRTSIITINYYSVPLINELELVVASITDKFELIVVDNSGDFVSAHSGTKVLRPEKNVGFGAGCNIGAGAASGSVYMFLNPDSIVDAPTITKLANAFPHEVDENIWGPLILDATGRIPVLEAPGRFGLAYRRLALERKDIGDNPRPVTYVSGACLLLGGQLFKNLGGFCESIFLYAEDLELCRRAKMQQGVGVTIHPCSEVLHEGGKSTSKLTVKLLRFWRSLNGHFRFFRMSGFGRIKAFVNSAHLASGVRF